MIATGPAPGTLFARDFRIVRPLSEGGMGQVFVAEQISTGALRALKLMHPVLVRKEKFIKRFEQEAKVGARIKSDHVVHVVAAGVDEPTGIPWMAMELLEGESLAGLFGRRGPLSVGETVEVMSQLCHGLGAAHAIGVVHRDLKPENVFLTDPRREGIPFTVKLLDFGIAKVIAEARTNHTEALGSVLWMAPEQTVAGAIVTPAADVWALGLLTFRMLTGVHYWKSVFQESASSAMVLREVVVEHLPPASERASEQGVKDRIPPGFDAWFAQCVNRDETARFADANAAKVALMHVLCPDARLPAEPQWATPSRLGLAQPAGASVQILVSREGVTLGDIGIATLRSGEEHPTGFAPPPEVPVKDRIIVVPSPRKSRIAGWLRIALVLAAVPLLALLAGGVLLHRRWQLQRACDADNAEACLQACQLALFRVPNDCLRAGEVYERRAVAADTLGRLRAEMRRRAARAYATACYEHHVLPACTRAGRVREQGIYQDAGLLRDEAEAAALYRKACQSGSGDIDGCVHYGSALRMGYGTGRHPDNAERYSQEAAKYFQMACDPERGGRGCFWVGYLYQYGGGGLKKNQEQAEKMYRLGCNGGHGDPLACNHLGEFYEHGHLSPIEALVAEHDAVFPQRPAEAMDRYALARRLWDQECQAGDPDSCLRVALLLWKGKSESPSDHREVDLLQVSCDMGYAPACHRLSDVCTATLAKLDGAKGGVSAMCDSPMLLGRACDGLWAFGCSSLGDIAQSPEQKRIAYQKAERLFLAWCDDGNGEACLQVAMMYAEGREGVSRNSGKAMAFFDRACDREDAEGCRRLGDVMRTGSDETEKNPQEALTNYRQACEWLNGSACYDAGQMVRAGEGMEAPNPADSARLFNDACDLRHAAGCFEIGRACEKGDGVRQDLTLARKYYERACDGHAQGVNYDACHTLGMLLIGSSVASERSRGHEALVAACDRGNLATACHQVAKNCASGIGTRKKDLDASQAYLRKACTLGHQPSCGTKR